MVYSSFILDLGQCDRYVLSHCPKFIMNEQVTEREEEGVIKPDGALKSHTSNEEFYF